MNKSIDVIIPCTIRVLLVEDNKAMKIAMKRLLKISKLQYKIDDCISIVEATYLLTENIYDIIILDVNIADSYGFETIETVYNIAVNTPILLFTSVNFKMDEIIKLYRTGIRGFINKMYLESDSINNIILLTIAQRHSEITILSAIKNMGTIPDVIKKLK